MSCGGSLRRDSVLDYRFVSLATKAEGAAGASILNANPAAKGLINDRRR